MSCAVSHGILQVLNSAAEGDGRGTPWAGLPTRSWCGGPRRWQCRGRYGDSSAPTSHRAAITGCGRRRTDNTRLLLPPNEPLGRQLRCAGGAGEWSCRAVYPTRAARLRVRRTRQPCDMCAAERPMALLRVLSDSAARAMGAGQPPTHCADTSCQVVASASPRHGDPFHSLPRRVRPWRDLGKP